MENCNLNDLSRLTEKTLDEAEINNNKKNKNLNLNLNNNSFNENKYTDKDNENDNDNDKDIDHRYNNYKKNNENNKIDIEFDFSEINSQLRAIKNEVGTFVKNENNKKTARENSSSATGNFGNFYSGSSRNINVLDKKNYKNIMPKDNLSRMDSDSKLSNITLSKLFFLILLQILFR